MVSMEFELEQVTSGTFDSYSLINPFPVICFRLVFMVSALAPARQAGRTRTDSRLPWICWQFRPPMTIQESCIMAV